MSESDPRASLPGSPGATLPRAWQKEAQNECEQSLSELHNPRELRAEEGMYDEVIADYGIS